MSPRSPPGASPADASFSPRPARWPVTAFTLVSALGRGRAATLDALAAGRSGLARRGFETAEIDTWLGVVDEIDEVSVPLLLVRVRQQTGRLF